MSEIRQLLTNLHFCRKQLKIALTWRTKRNSVRQLPPRTLQSNNVEEARINFIIHTCRHIMFVNNFLTPIRVRLSPLVIHTLGHSGRGD